MSPNELSRAELAVEQGPSPWRRAFVLSLPILAGYLPIGAAFGVLWVQQGLVAWGAPLFGIVLYAGAAQFMAAGMLAAGQGPVEIALAALVLNARHAVYGLAFLERFPGWSAAKAYFAFALTDETYAILAGHPPEEADQPLLWRVALLNQFYWVAGCAAGALAGGLVTGGTRGLDFALQALFIVLLLEQVRTRRKGVAAAVGGSVALAGVLLFGTANTLMPVMLAALLAAGLVDRRSRAWG